MNTNLTRRTFFKTAGIALALIPLAGIHRQAMATTNPAIRAKLKYQSTPKDNMTCTSCLEFVPGKTAKDLGGYKVIPGDNEIAPDGYCTSWNTM